MAIAASFAGNLGQDGELRFVGQGTPLLSFSVAVSYFDKEKKTQWVRCSLFGKRAETLTPMMLKGTTVFVRGTVRLNEFVPRDGGEKKTSLECNVDDVELLGGKREGGAQQPGARPANRPAPAAYGGGAGYGAPGDAAEFGIPGGLAPDGDIPFISSAFDPHHVSRS